jgi:hypothetical protein
MGGGNGAAKERTDKDEKKGGDGTMKNRHGIHPRFFRLFDTQADGPNKWARTHPKVFECPHAGVRIYTCCNVPGSLI